MKKLTALFDLPVLSDINVKAMVLDSRKVTQGDLFVAVKGHRFDASQFVPQAISSGAIAVVLETDLENEHLNIQWQNNVPVIHFNQDRKSTRLNSSHSAKSRMPSSA